MTKGEKKVTDNMTEMHKILTKNTMNIGKNKAEIAKKQNKTSR